MKKKWILSIFIGLFILLSANACQEQDSVLIPNTTPSKSSLSKQSWQYVDKSWPNQQTEVEPNCYTFTNPDDILTVSNSGYTFTFSVSSYAMTSSEYEVVVKVNGTVVTTIDFSQNYDDFTYDGKSMEVQVLHYGENVYNNCLQHTFFYVYPHEVETKVLDYVNPDAPSGLSVSPKYHPSQSADPVLTWSQTSDDDVTHVEIWRRNNVPFTSYSLITTIAKTSTSYTDYSCDWNLPMGRTYWYKIRFKDATHNLYSAYTDEEFSSSL